MGFVLGVGHKPLSYLRNGKICHISEQNKLARLYRRNPILFSLISGKKNFYLFQTFK
jgi:hypothetical protein